MWTMALQELTGDGGSGLIIVLVLLHVEEGCSTVREPVLTPRKCLLGHLQ